jgi:predicted O-methyltransferase YrrM
MQGPPERHQYFLPVVSGLRRAGAGSLEILELGSWAGASTVTFALALQQTAAAGRVTCGDAWTPYFDTAIDTYPQHQDMNAAAADSLIFPLFEHNIRAAGVAGMVKTHRGLSRDVLPGFADGSFDIIYIDASHQFEDVRSDIRQAKRLLRGNGVICGDDLELQAGAVPEAELRDAIQQHTDFVYSESAASHYHPGVTGAVAEEFPSVGVWSGFWAVQRCGGAWKPPVLDLKDLRLPDHLPTSDETPRLVGFTEVHNLVQAGGQYFAISKALGPIALFQERFGDRDLPPVLFVGSSLEEVRARSEAMSSPVPAANSVQSHPSHPDGFNGALENLRTEVENLAEQHRSLAGRISSLERELSAAGLLRILPG